MAGVADPTGRSRSVASFDADRDGRLDVLLANFATPNRLLRKPATARSRTSGPLRHLELSATHVAWTDVDGDGYPDLLLSGTPKGLRFLHNAGGQRFEDWTVRVGLSRESGSVQAMAFGDYDNDGALDLYMSYGSDFSDVALEHDDGRITFAFFAREGPSGLDFESSGSGEPLRVDLYENGGPVAPERVTCAGVRHVERATFECARANANGVAPTGDLGFFLWQDAPSGTPCASCLTVSSWHLQWRGSGDHHLSGVLYASRRPVPHGFQRPPATGGVLWKGDASGGFERVSMASLAHDGNGQAVQWADVDNDGLLDLYVVDSGLDGAGGRNRLFVQTPEHDFVAVPPTSGASPPSGNGRGVGAHFFDFDGDGRQDLFLTNGWGAPPFDQGPYRLLRNASPPRHWLDVVQGRVEPPGLERRSRSKRRHAIRHTSSNFTGDPPHFARGCGQLGVRAWPSGVQQDATSRPISATNPGGEAGGRDHARVDACDMFGWPPRPAYAAPSSGATGRHHDRHAPRRSSRSLRYERPTSPNLIALAKDGITYTHAICPTWTVPSHGSLFTGRWPSFHGAERVPGNGILAYHLNPEAPTLAELLHASGFHSAAFVGNATYVSPIFGFGRGFDEFFDKDLNAPDRLSRDLIAWLHDRNDRVFLFVNILDPHEPYAPPPPLDTMFPTKHAELGTMISTYMSQGGAVTEAAQEHFVSQYDGEIVFADQAVGAILGELKRAGRYDDALIVLLSDHGELLFEHGLAGHGLAPYEPEVHVPLVVKLPGSVRGGEKVERTVSTLGVFATIPAFGIAALRIQSVAPTSRTLSGWRRFGW